MRAAQRVKGVVNARGTVRVLERVDLPAGECELLVLPCSPEPEEKPKLKPLKPALEKLLGLWADRDDITDSAKYAAELRRRLETRRDRRG